MAKWSKQTYELVAGNIKEIPSKAERIRQGEKFAVQFANDNPRFNLPQFLKAARATRT